MTVPINEARKDELGRVEETVRQLMNVDFAGEYDDRRGLEAVMGYIESRRVELLAEGGNGEA